MKRTKKQPKHMPKAMFPIKRQDLTAYHLDDRPTRTSRNNIRQREEEEEEEEETFERLKANLRKICSTS